MILLCPELECLAYDGTKHNLYLVRLSFFFSSFCQIVYEYGVLIVLIEDIALAAAHEAANGRPGQRRRVVVRVVVGRVHALKIIYERERKSRPRALNLCERGGDTENMCFMFPFFFFTRRTCSQIFK